MGEGGPLEPEFHLASTNVAVRTVQKRVLKSGMTGENHSPDFPQSLQENVWAVSLKLTTTVPSSTSPPITRSLITLSLDAT